MLLLAVMLLAAPEGLAEKLRQEGISAEAYHAGMDRTARWRGLHRRCDRTSRAQRRRRARAHHLEPSG